MSLSMADSSSSLAAWSEVTLLRLVISERASNLQERRRESAAGRGGASTGACACARGQHGVCVQDRVQERGQHMHAGLGAGQDRTGQRMRGMLQETVLRAGIPRGVLSRCWCRWLLLLQQGSLDACCFLDVLAAHAQQAWLVEPNICWANTSKRLHKLTTLRHCRQWSPAL